MSKSTTRGYRYVLLLSIVVSVTSVVYFLYTAHTKWQDLIRIGKSIRSSAIQYALDVQKADTPIKTRDKVQFESTTDSDKNTFLNSSRKPNKQTSGSTECPEGKVYFSNNMYNCDGIMKDADDDKREVTDDKKALNNAKVSTNVGQMTSKLKHGSAEQTSDTPTRQTGKKENTIPRKMFVNCGGTFPWAVELFLDTYPNASTFEIFTFLTDKSYKIMYSKFPNHTVILSEASYKNSSKNTDIISFGAGSKITQSTFQIDLAEWLKANTKQSDFVILRLESEEENKIVEHLNKSKMLERIDKYYTTQGINASKQDIEVLLKTLRQFKVKAEMWDNKAQTYTDFYVLNSNHIPPPGKLITSCQQMKDKEKFALFLFSPYASVNALKVINFLHLFSPKNRLQLTLFLPYEVFKSGLINMENLFGTFHVGMFCDEYGIQADDELQYKKLRNKFIFVKKLFDRHGEVFQYAFAGNNTRNKIIASIQENHHYSFIKGGTDITHLTEKTLQGKTLSIDDTGKESGDILLVNIDTPNTEYLVLYLIRRFVPWLLNLSECDVIKYGELNLKQNDISFL